MVLGVIRQGKRAGWLFKESQTSSLTQPLFTWELKSKKGK